MAEDSSHGVDRSVVDEVLRRAEYEVRGAIKKFQTIEVGSILEARIVAELSCGRRSVAELTCQIFETETEKSDYAACYDRVRRALKILEGRGYVSRRLFGKEKPYRLTNLALARLLRLDPGRRVSKWFDYAVFSAFITLAAITISLTGSNVVGMVFFAVYSGFLVLGGVCATRVAQMIHEVV